VVGRAGERGVQAGPPVGERLARGAVDEVEADGETGVPRPPDGLRDPRRPVRAVERGQHVRHRGLHAERDARDAAAGERPQALRRHGVGVGLDGDLGVRGDADRVAGGVQQADQVGGREQGGRAAAEEHRGRGTFRQAGGVEDRGGEPQLGRRRPGVLRPARSPAQLGGRVGVEVAVAAADRAERDVQVQPEGTPAGAGGGGRRQRAVRGCRVARRGWSGHVRRAAGRPPARRTRGGSA
jgi:hypothetical protein